MQLFVFTKELYNRFYGAVSITVVLRETDNKVYLFIFYFFFAFANMQEIFFAIYVFAEKSMFDVLCTCKATSLSKMAKLVWGYSDDARAIIENVYKFCMEEKKSVTESCMEQDCSTHWR